MERTRFQHAVSAGGVVYRKMDNSVQIALCGRTCLGTWNLPKGTPDKGETLEQTALREAREETGLQVQLQESLGSITYWFTVPSEDVRYRKEVHFYLMEERGGSVGLHDPEFDVVRWFPVQEALSSLTHANEGDVLRRALDTLVRKGVIHD
jgi:8-oxo-dGTP pyrophosphatase MutT (NUDIX family)